MMLMQGLLGSNPSFLSHSSDDIMVRAQQGWQLRKQRWCMRPPISVRHKVAQQVTSEVGIGSKKANGEAGSLALLISWEVRTQTSGEGPTTLLPSVLQEYENAGFVGLSWHLRIGNLLFLCFPLVQKNLAWY